MNISELPSNAIIVANRVITAICNGSTEHNVTSEEVIALASALSCVQDIAADMGVEEMTQSQATDLIFQGIHVAVDQQDGPVMSITCKSSTNIPDGRSIINGNIYMGDSKGGFQPVETIKPQHILEDETVRRIVGYAIPLSDQIGRFKEHTFDDIGAFEAILAQEYETTVGGKKGNKTLLTVDGLFKVQVQVSDFITFGPELEIAKVLVDECMNEWASTAGPELRTIVTNAFRTDKAGQINRSEIFMLLRLEIEDARWQRGMRAIRDAMRVVGSKTYVRCYQRPRHDAPWQAVVIDLAKV